MSRARLQLEGLVRRHAGAARAAVQRFDLAVAAGELVALLGPSGCGKTTVLRMVAGLEPPDAGRIRIDGADVTALAPSERPVSLVFQNYALFPHLSVLDNVAFGLRASGQSAERAREQAHAALELVELDGVTDRATHALSGGQQQRVALARALALEPAVLLFDEPLSNLDEALRRQVREQIRTLQRRLGLTVLYVTHDQAEAMAVSDRVVVMNEGRVAQVGRPRELYEHPASPFVAGFMGEGRLIDAQVGDDGLLRIAGTLVVPSGRALAPGTVQVMVRPHGWRIEPASSRGLPARVLRSAYLGRGIETTVLCALGEVLVVSAGARRTYEIGAPASLTIDAGGAAVLG
ncbi:MAG: ABC transporter ATP-binding protein [Burkholderiaceae bacterium]|nr:ABC transporter ATP-binding protein [Burkholderiaceae bacterium]